MRELGRVTLFMDSFPSVVGLAGFERHGIAAEMAERDEGRRLWVRHGLSPIGRLRRRVHKKSCVEVSRSRILVGKPEWRSSVYMESLRQQRISAATGEFAVRDGRARWSASN